jgi:hypothetical protein
MKKKLMIGAGAAALALVLSACAGAGGAAPSGSGDDVAPVWEPGPLDRFWSEIHGFDVDGSPQSQNEAQAEMDRQNREVQDIIASCMAEQGFEYIPDLQAGGSVHVAQELEYEWGTLAFAERFGFGISTDPWGWNDRDHAEEEPWVDVNADVREGMSESEEAAWWLALHGEGQEWDEEDESTWEWNWELSGCSGYAQNRVHGVARGTDGEFAWLMDEAQRMWEAMEADPRVVAANAELRQCMVAAGQTEIDHNDLWQQWNDIAHGGDEWWDSIDWGNWDWDANPDGPPPFEPNPAQIEAFTEREIELAIADWHCRRDADHHNITQTVNHELQQQFVDQHGDALTAFRDYMVSRREG